MSSTRSAPALALAVAVLAAVALVVVAADSGRAGASASAAPCLRGESSAPGPAPSNPDDAAGYCPSSCDQSEVDKVCRGGQDVECRAFNGMVHVKCRCGDARVEAKLNPAGKCHGRLNSPLADGQTCPPAPTPAPPAPEPEPAPPAPLLVSNAEEEIPCDGIGQGAINFEALCGCQSPRVATCTSAPIQLEPLKRRVKVNCMCGDFHNFAVVVVPRSTSSLPAPAVAPSDLQLIGDAEAEAVQAAFEGSNADAENALIMSADDIDGGKSKSGKKSSGYCPTACMEDETDKICRGASELKCKSFKGVVHVKCRCGGALVEAKLNPAGKCHGRLNSPLADGQTCPPAQSPAPPAPATAVLGSASGVDQGTV